MAIQLPTILQANTYYWKTKGQNSAARKRTEIKYLTEVSNFLESIGFDITEKSANTIKATKNTLKGLVEVEFYIKLSCLNFYKNFTVIVNGKKSNITTIKSMIGDN